MNHPASQLGQTPPPQRDSKLPVVELTAMGNLPNVAACDIDEQILLTLSRSLYRTEGHPLFVGDRGIGKTTILKEFVRSKVGQAVPDGIGRWIPFEFTIVL